MEKRETDATGRAIWYRTIMDRPVSPPAIPDLDDADDEPDFDEGRVTGALQVKYNAEGTCNAHVTPGVTPKKVTPGVTTGSNTEGPFLKDQITPNPEAGNSGQSVNLEGIAGELLERARSAGVAETILAHLFVPILERRRFSAANRDAELLALANAAAGLSVTSLRKAAEIVLAPNVTTIKARRIADAIAAVKSAGQMFMARVGTPQHGAWLEHYAETNPNAARFAKTRDVQVPSEWPPAKSKRGAA